MTEEIHQLSEAVTEDEANLGMLERQKERSAADLARRQDEIAHLLLTLQRIARIPPLAFTALPQSPGDIVRSMLLLRTGFTTLRQETERLESEIASLSSLGSEISRKRARRDATLSKLKSERRIVAVITKEKQRLLDGGGRKGATPGMPPAETGRLARRPPAPDRERLRRSDAQAETTPDDYITASDDVPAPGRVITRFDQKLGNGSLSRGITVATRPSEQVVAPFHGRVVFASRFAEYGNLVIVKSRDDRHALVAGMARIDAVPGEEVLAGEPIGVMASALNGPSRLYYELRKNGRPINPLPSRAALKNRVRSQ